MLCRLNLGNCKLSLCHVLEVLDALMDKTSLCYLNISGSKVDTSAADKITTLISTNRSIKKIRLRDCEMQEDSAIAVVTSALKVTDIQVVDISCNPLEHISF